MVVLDGAVAADLGGEVLVDLHEPFRFANFLPVEIEAGEVIPHFLYSVFNKHRQPPILKPTHHLRAHAQIKRIANHHRPIHHNFRFRAEITHQLIGPKPKPHTMDLPVVEFEVFQNELEVGDEVDRVFLGEVV